MNTQILAITVSLIIGISLYADKLEINDGQNIAILSGQHFKLNNWSPSGYMSLASTALKSSGIKKFPFINLENQTTSQMLNRLEKDVIEKKPIFVFIIPGSKDFHPWRQKPPSETYKNNLRQIIKKLKTAKIKTAIITSLVRNCDINNPINNNAVKPHNEFIRKLAAEDDVILIDFAKRVSDEAPKADIAFDGNLAAKCLISQLFAAEILSALGFSDEKIYALRQKWGDIPGAITFQPSVSVNTFEKLKEQAKSANMTVADYMSKILHDSTE